MTLKEFDVKHAALRAEIAALRPPRALDWR